METRVPPAASRADAERLDRRDRLALCRRRFVLPAGVVYLDGNSLGALPATVAPRLERVIGREWGEQLVRSWNDPWIDVPRSVATKVARLLGADPADVVVADSVSVNLFKLLAAALALRPERRLVLVPENDFPTDVYVARGLAELLAGRAAVKAVAEAELADHLDGDVAVLSLSHVDFKSGRRRDMAGLTAAAHACGALALWDLSHSAGVLDLDLEAAGVDLAVGCGYKYLNGGPGAPSFLYVAPRHQERARSPIWGWLGHADYMAFEPAYRPAPGVERFSCGTWPILSLAAFDAALDAFDGADMGLVEEKAGALGGLLIERLEQRCAAFPLEVVSPRDPARRGAHVAVRHPQAYAVMQALKARGVIGDFRTPDLMRFGLAPLYLRYADVWDAVEILHEVLATASWDRPEHHRRQRIT
ncbi:MAG: kynureninase [Acidobacteria bacterium]|nr:MAG: kynureninase [Acidobacteriota bacterium]